jgi:serine/threonine protein kinase
MTNEVPLGQVLSHYRVLARLGEGGMGVVYRAHDEALQRDVALKVLPARSLDDAGARARLLREARLASSLAHPGICTVYEVGESQGQIFVAMELVEGTPLSAMVPSAGMPVPTAARYATEIADAIAHAHERGVIHRDL